MAENLFSKKFNCALDMLAAVASETLKKERKLFRSLKIAFPENKKQSKKRHASSEDMSFEDIKALSTKVLVEKFSELSSDEMNRKYSYRCLLFPDRCNMIFRSFGNEKKACDQIKLHLAHHLNQPNPEINDSISAEAPFSEKKLSSPCTLQKTALINPNLSSQDFPGESESRRCSRSQSTDSYYVKKMVTSNGINDVKSSPVSNGRSPVKRNCKHPRKSRKPQRSVFASTATSATTTTYKCEIKDEAGPSGLHINPKDLVKRNTKGNSQSEVSERSRKPQRSVFASTATSTTTNTYKCDIKDEAGPSGMHINPKDLVQRNKKGNAQSEISGINVESESSTSSNSTMSLALHNLTLMFEHNYASLNGNKIERAPYESRKKVPKMKKHRKFQKQFIIKTPKFPYLHVPDAYVVTEIVELAPNGKRRRRKQYENVDCLNITEYIATKKKRKEVSPARVRNLTAPSKKEDVTGLVLECVENRVNVKASATSAPKSTYSSADNNVENSENVQKVTRELALKLIAKLHLKKKKQYNGPLECQICQDKHFTALATLIHHYRSHAGIKPFVCNLCSATFTRQHSLKYHLSIHENRIRFVCDYCDRTFRHPSHFKEHTRRHTGETPFRCPHCDMRFKTRNTFKRHLKIQHKKLLTAHGIVDIPSVENNEGILIVL